MSEESLLSSRSPQRLVLFRNLLFGSHSRLHTESFVTYHKERGGGGRVTASHYLSFPAFLFLAPLPPDSCPSLYYSRLQINKKNQKPGFLASHAKTYHSWQFADVAFFLGSGGNSHKMNIITGQLSLNGYHSLTIDSIISLCYKLATKFWLLELARYAIHTDLSRNRLRYENVSSWIFLPLKSDILSQLSNSQLQLITF